MLVILGARRGISASHKRSVLNMTSTANSVRSGRDWEIFRDYGWIMGFCLVGLLRLVFCTEAPIESSDLYRHLGFTSHFLQYPGKFYWLLPSDFPNEFWSDFWSDQVYIYPPFALFFFSFFGTLGLGLFWVKLVLSLCDLATALLIGRATNWWVGLLVFSAPASVWYTSHEGQYESLVTLLMVLAILCARKNHWKLAGVAFMLAVQTKQLGILIAPYLVYEIFQRARPERIRAGLGFLIASGVTFLPCVPFYWGRPGLWFLPLENQQNLLNPFYWPFFPTNFSVAHFDDCSNFRVVWNIVVTLVPLALLALFLGRGHFLKKLPQALPSIGFWVMIKSIAWAMNWYMLMLPGCTFALWRHRRVMIALLVIFWLQCGQQLACIIGDMRTEEPATIARFQKCIWFCDYRAPEDPDTPETGRP